MADFQVAYGGEALREHSMDVQHLAPALLALGNLIRDANAELNGERTKVRVLVRSDFEHKCFNVHITLVQSVIDQVTSLLHASGVTSTKDLLEILGLLGLLPAGGVIGLLKWRRGRQVAVTEILDKSPRGDVRITTGDGASVVVNQTVYALSENHKIKKAVAGVLEPLKSPGINRVEFRGEAAEAADLPVVIDESAAVEIRASCELPADEIAFEPQPVIAHLRVHSPVFDSDAERWRFRYGEEVIYADIKSTTIAQDAIDRGGVFVDDLYKVKLEITEHATPQNQFRKSYKIMEVLEFTPSPRQRSLFT